MHQVASGKKAEDSGDRNRDYRSHERQEDGLDHLLDQSGKDLPVRPKQSIGHVRHAIGAREHIVQVDLGDVPPEDQRHDREDQTDDADLRAKPGHSLRRDTLDLTLHGRQARDAFAEAGAPALQKQSDDQAGQHTRHVEPDRVGVAFEPGSEKVHDGCRDIGTNQPVQGDCLDTRAPDRTFVFHRAS